MKQITSYAETNQDKCCGFITLAYLVKNSLASRLQLIILLIVIIVFGSFVTSYFFEARRNELAEWKPLKITKAIEYGNTDEQYDMPYVFIAFAVTYNYTTSTISETLSEIEASQTRRRNLCIIKYFSVSGSFPVECELLASRYEGRPTGSRSEFWGYLRVKLENPRTGNGSFVWSFSLTASDMISTNAIAIDGFYGSITRDEVPADFSNFIYLNADDPLAGNTGISYTVDYTESIVDGISWMTNSIAWSSPLERDTNFSTDGNFRFTARPNLRVVFYEEYVVFGYSDWVFGMGGLYNLFAFGFFYTAYYAAVFCNDNWSMGILPRLSFIFQNFEMIQWLKHNTWVDNEIDDNDLHV